MKTLIIILIIISTLSIQGTVGSKRDHKSVPVNKTSNYYGNKMNWNQSYCFISALHYINIYYISQNDNPISTFDSIDILTEPTYLYEEKGTNLTLYHKIVAKFNNDQYQDNVIACFYVSDSSIQSAKASTTVYNFIRDIIIEGLQSSFKTGFEYIELLS